MVLESPRRGAGNAPNPERPVTRSDFEAPVSETRPEAPEF